MPIRSRDLGPAGVNFTPGRASPGVAKRNGRGGLEPEPFTYEVTRFGGRRDCGHMQALAKASAAATVLCVPIFLVEGVTYRLSRGSRLRVSWFGCRSSDQIVRRLTSYSESLGDAAQGTSSYLASTLDVPACINGIFQPKSEERNGPGGLEPEPFTREITSFGGHRDCGHRQA
jgi:hypothetical protein